VELVAMQNGITVLVVKGLLALLGTPKERLRLEMRVEAILKRISKRTEARIELLRWMIRAE
jgi:hypothetical protein